MNSFIAHRQTLQSALAALLVLPIMLGVFLAFEPTVTSSASVSETFTVQQEIGGEIAFTADPQNIVLDEVLQGLTGGTSNGSTTFAITTNSPIGYTVTISFSSTTAMSRDGGGGSIPNLGAVVSNFNAAAVADSAGFGYTVTGPQVVDALKDVAGTCGSGTASAEFCWTLQANAESAYTLIDSDDPSAGVGDSYDLYFRVVVDQDPSVPLPQGMYTATTTLTAINKE